MVTSAPKAIFPRNTSVALLGLYALCSREQLQRLYVQHVLASFLNVVLRTWELNACRKACRENM